jgi:ABC-type transport system involved in Fe-S cluster assembly fused permease/ATPase subunit
MTPSATTLPLVVLPMRRPIERAAKAAHVLEFASKLPQGMETTVGERGVLASGGQKQPSPLPVHC